MTKSKKTKTTRKTKTAKTRGRSTRTRNLAHTGDAESIGATWTDVLLGALPILASFLDDKSEDADRAPLCSVCGRLLELPGAEHDRAPTDRITPFPAYRELGALFTKAAA